MLATRVQWLLQLHQIAAVGGYSSLNNAFITLFRALMGDLDFEAMEAQAGRFIAPRRATEVDLGARLSFDWDH